ncbi:hypothetical protein HI914_00188 [Erysiphe necator]|nr:hypothetical protein HI914_00188 [Erysiphe necator]
MNITCSTIIIAEEFFFLSIMTSPSTCIFKIPQVSELGLNDKPKIIGFFVGKVTKIKYGPVSSRKLMFIWFKKNSKYFRLEHFEIVE